MKASKNIASRAAKSKVFTDVPTYIEKATISSDNSFAKVLFRVAVADASKAIASTKEMVINSVNSKFNGAARLVEASIMEAEKKGYYYGIVVANQERIDRETAEKQGFSLVAANAFADEEDNIWEVESSSNGKILIRKEEDNLQDLLSISTSPMSVTASSISLDSSVGAGEVIAFFDADKERVRKGLTIDRNHACDLNSMRVFKFDQVSVLASTGAIKNLPKDIESNVYGSKKDATYEEVAADPNAKAAIVAYLTQLYSQNKAFLDAYLKAVDQFFGA